MKIPSTLPITGEQSRAARFQLGLTQANVIEESGLPGHKLKNFETGRFVPDMPFLENLRDYYAGRGIDFAESATPAEQPAHSGITSGASMIRPVSRMCFYVSDQVPDAMVEQILGRMDANDERIALIMEARLTEGFLSKYDEETDKKLREVFAAMAENYLAFRCLQGRNIVSMQPSSASPATVAELLANLFAASPVVSALNPIPAVARRVEDGGEGEIEEQIVLDGEQS